MSEALSTSIGMHFNGSLHNALHSDVYAEWLWTCSNVTRASRRKAHMINQEIKLMDYHPLRCLNKGHWLARPHKIIGSLGHTGMNNFCKYQRQRHRHSRSNARTNLQQLQTCRSHSSQISFETNFFCTKTLEDSLEGSKNCRSLSAPPLLNSF